MYVSVYTCIPAHILKSKSSVIFPKKKHCLQFSKKKKWGGGVEESFQNCCCKILGLS